MTELEVMALMADQSRAEYATALVEKYRRQLFPGAEVDQKKDKQMEEAKRLLAEEAKKVYLVRKVEGAEALRKTVEAAQARGNTDFAKAAEYELYKRETEANRLRQRMSRNKTRGRGEGKK